MADTRHEPAEKILLHGTPNALPLTGGNPSRAYMNRVVQVFKSGAFTAGGKSVGSGQRGSIQAVLAAILLDQEAWQPTRTQYLRNPSRLVLTTLGTEDSRVQEPVVNYTRILRVLDRNWLRSRARLWHVIPFSRITGFSWFKSAVGIIMPTFFRTRIR